MATQEPVDVPTVEVLERVKEGLEGLDTKAEDGEQTPEEEIDPIIVALKKERLSLNLTQWDVARRMGQTSGARVSQLESGEYDLQLSTLRAWANALEVDVLVRKPKGNQGRPRRDFR